MMVVVPMRYVSSISLEGNTYMSKTTQMKVASANQVATILSNVWTQMIFSVLSIRGTMNKARIQASIKEEYSEYRYTEHGNIIKKNVELLEAAKCIRQIVSAAAGHIYEVTVSYKIGQVERNYVPSMHVPSQITGTGFTSATRAAKKSTQMQQDIENDVSAKKITIVSKFAANALEQDDASTRKAALAPKKSSKKVVAPLIPAEPLTPAEIAEVEQIAAEEQVLALLSAPLNHLAFAKQIKAKVPNAPASIIADLCAAGKISKIAGTKPITYKRAEAPTS
jgi:hypothetical protein